MSISTQARAQLRAAFATGASIAVLALSAAPAHAQNEPQPDVPSDTPAPAADQGANTILVTGSRIARRDYTATSPIVTETSGAVLSQTTD